MFRKILFATSITPACEHAARVAFDLARRDGAELILFHVLGVPHRGDSNTVVDVRSGREVLADEEHVAKVRAEVRDFHGPLLERCACARIVVVVGNPYREILREARVEDADLIVMGASAGEEGAFYRRDSGITGTTLQLVAKSAKCPVLTVARPVASSRGGFSRIVFATDLSKAADHAFEFASKAARELDAELHIFHALDLTFLHSAMVTEQEYIERRLREARDKMSLKYLPAMKDFKRYDITAWEGIPYMEICKFARERQADLIVMSHPTRELDPDKARVGSTLDQVIVRATCPVCSVNKG